MTEQRHYTAEMKGKPVHKRGKGKGSSEAKPKLLTAYNIFQRVVHKDMYRKLGGKECLVFNLQANHQISTKVCR